MMMRAAIAIAALLTGACGGKQSEDTTPNTSVATSEHEPPADNDGVMIPPESIDEITRALGRKRQVVSRCLAEAIDNKELPKGARGKVTLEIVIAPSGKAAVVRVIRATVESEMLNNCVIARVQEIQFPELPKKFETSYTYGFEAM